MSRLFRLSNGKWMPSVGLGTWLSSAGDVYKAVKYAIEKANYRHIDCALVYKNEAEVGKALKDVIANGTVKRDDLFITAKCWNSDHSRHRVMNAIKRSLSDLNIDYIDLYLIHWPIGFKENADFLPKDVEGDSLYSDVDYVETWKGMEDCYKAGLAKSIGLSNFNSEQIKRVLDAAKVKPVVNQVECHPYLNQSKLIEFCKSYDILITAFSPLGSPFNPFRSAGEPMLLQDEKIQQIAEKNNKTAAQIIIRYQLQRGVAVIPKSITPSRILSNIQVFDFKLSADDMATIDGCNKNHRFIRLDFLKSHKYYPFSIPF